MKSFFKQKKHEDVQLFLNNARNKYLELKYQIYEFFNFIIIDKKENFFKRFGIESSNIINCFLNFCLKYQQDNTSLSLENFINFIVNSDINISSELDCDNTNSIKITTIHSAKGLESPIIILADTAHDNKNIFGNNNDTVKWSEDNSYLIWPAGRTNKLLTSLKEREKEIKNAEYLRLLYVAMTRAEEELYITGFGDKTVDYCWYNIIKSSILKEKNTFIEGDNIVFGDNEYEFDHGSKVELSCTKQDNIIPNIDYYKNRFNTVDNLNTSASKVLSNINSNDKEIKKGDIIHKILEILPNIKNNKRQLIINYLDKINFSQKEKDYITNKIFLLLKKFSHFFLDNSRSEVAVTGVIKDKFISGVIDRIVFEKDKIIIIDYKTNNIDLLNDSIINKYKKQLGLYRSLLSNIYPDKQIEALIIWTETLEASYIS